MSDCPKSVFIFGSTGSIGRSALDLLRHYPERFTLAGIAAHSNVDALAAQIQEFSPPTVAVADPSAAARLRTLFPGRSILEGERGIEEAARQKVDVALFAMVGAVGLTPLMAAIETGNRVAVANKEPFVMAGELIMKEAALRGVSVLPVDSEHSAIFQCLQGNAKDHVRTICLTASGGPFYQRSRESLLNVTPEEATRHPTWDMGAKISVDSATLMNKGLEIIEAMWLFGLPEHKIEVVIHPQSIVHGFVEFIDGNVLAHLGVTDMRFPILFALSYPQRVEYNLERLNISELGELTFAPPSFESFPCLAYARQAAREGGTVPAVLNAANEEAVSAFREHRLPFLGISEVTQEVLQRCMRREAGTLESLLHADREAREIAKSVIVQRGNR